MIEIEMFTSASEKPSSNLINQLRVNVLRTEECL